jgi:hypothetical protein
MSPRLVAPLERRALVALAALVASAIALSIPWPVHAGEASQPPAAPVPAKPQPATPLQPPPIALERK